MLNKRLVFGSVLLLLLFLLLNVLPTVAQVPEPEPRTSSGGSVTDQGTVFIAGEANYTFPYFRLFLPQPFVVLYDVTGQVVDRNVDFFPAPKSQVFGTILTDPFVSPFQYELQLPARPQGELRDVDQNGQDNGGVMIFAVVLASNTWGDPFLEERDNFIAGILNSAVISTDIDSFLQVEGGSLLIYAPDSNQSFPSGFGDDGLLFTGDDPVAQVAAGYTLIDLSDPNNFIFDRTPQPDVALVEAEDAELDDFSALGYVDAFDAMIELLRQKYAFTDYKQIDWDQIIADYRPLIETAEEANDLQAFRLALAQIALSIPDGHVSGPVDIDEFRTQVSGGFGLAVRQLDDGRVLVTYIAPGGPADQAGIKIRAEITAINDTPIEQALAETRAWSSASTEHNLRLDQLSYVLRFPIDTPASLTYINPDEAEATVDLVAVFDSNGLQNSGYRTSGEDLTPGEMPVEYIIRDDGFAYVKIYGFTDNLPLTVALWERFIQTIMAQGALGVVIDMRENGGGSGFLGDQLPAYFFDDTYLIGKTARYSETRGEFAINPKEDDNFILPGNDLYYAGPVAVIISPNCASACESFAWAMTVNNRAGIIGNYPTAGLGGSVVPIALPDDTTFNYTNARSLDADGNINIEGIGVVPTVRVPVTEETLFSDSDVLLDAALDYLRDELNFVGLGETVSG
ncbi:MAG: PDZ domain-containing protein, partial [Anaerolineae bacterium]|nr:PDZ domain-containing protein [Anaerolineae bacterium]